MKKIIILNQETGHVHIISYSDSYEQPSTYLDSEQFENFKEKYKINISNCSWMEMNSDSVIKFD